MTKQATEIAIIGAGTAGCMLANQLDQAGIDCVLIEKSRGFGGRCSRRLLDGRLNIDLGAAHIATDTPVFHSISKKISNWVALGYLTPWSKTVSDFDSHKQEQIESLCAIPSMNTLHKHIAGHITMLNKCRVSKFNKSENRWYLLDDNSELIIKARKVVVTTPPEQAHLLLKDFDGFEHCEFASHQSLPQYVCALGFTEPTGLEAGIYQGRHNLLDKAIREDSKPGRHHLNELREIWVLHSTHKWAKEQKNTAHQTAAIAMADSFCQQLEIESMPLLLTSHYWRLARHKPLFPENPTYIWSDELQIGCCGGWLESDDIPGALKSAIALAEDFLL